MLYDPYSSPNINQVIKLRKLKWAGHVAYMGRGAVCAGLWWGDLMERYYLEDKGVDVRIILKWVFKKWDGITDWIDVARHRNRWLAVVDAVMNLRVSKIYCTQLLQ
jgi:hypothetical protein